MALLEIRGLKTHFKTDDGWLHAVDGVDIAIDRGETVGVVGESGCGKSVTAKTVMKLIDMPPGKIVAGQVLWKGRDLVPLPPEAMQKIRAKEISIIFQEPMTSLNPVFTVGEQIAESVRLHEGASRAEAMNRAVEMLKLVGIPTPERRIKDYPHQFSGGMRQRVMIAIALACNPKLLIADEPTTALDVTIQGQILAEMQKLVREAGTSLLWITHDLAVVAGLADDVCVMYAGRIVEQGTVDAVLDRPLHPYTRGLLDSVPGRNRRGEPLAQIPGNTPSLLLLPQGCAFRNRCSRATDTCLAEPPLYEIDDRRVRCFHPIHAEDEAWQTS